MSDEPDYRFSLANERTFLAWIRTSLALSAAGVALPHLATDVPWVIGVVLVGFGAVIAALAHRRWAGIEQAMRRGQPLPPWPLRTFLGPALAVATLAVVVALVVR
ncbi:YidH family protein [Actinokineospora sp. HUAS TT18]|uniref:YidH family protein n=1 Tax=Actinokineospora sp. HUAS TT18 TaxID=3447451 RepID=UPI003F521025